MLNTLSNLKHKWPRGIPIFSFKFFFFCVVHAVFSRHVFFLFPFQSLKLSNRFVAGIRLPHAKVNKDLVELLHPKVTLFFSISRQPVPKRQRTQWRRCTFLYLCLVILRSVKSTIHGSPNSSQKNKAKYSTICYQATWHFHFWKSWVLCPQKTEMGQQDKKERKVNQRVHMPSQSLNI